MGLEVWRRVLLEKMVIHDVIVGFGCKYKKCIVEGTAVPGKPDEVDHQQAKPKPIGGGHGAHLRLSMHAQMIN